MKYTLHGKKWPLEITCACIIAGVGATPIVTTSELTCFAPRSTTEFCATSPVDLTHLPEELPPASSTASVTVSGGGGHHVLRAADLSTGSPVLGTPSLTLNVRNGQ